MPNAVNALLVTLGKIPRLLVDMDRFIKGLREICRAIWRILQRLLRRERRHPQLSENCCIRLPSDVYKRPDPLIYSQFYLMKMGLAVTWDNPDIQLFEIDPNAPNGNGAWVASSDLKPDHIYRVQVRVWNGSYDAPAVGLPVHLSYLTFGANTVSTPIATTYVDLGVKGSAHHPAFAFFDWKTPKAGHYCLQVHLEWADDANPDNNLGQENVDVGSLHSPAEFTFILRNDASVPRRYLLEADSYTLPQLDPCDEELLPPKLEGELRLMGTIPQTRLEESRTRWERARTSQCILFKFPGKLNLCKINIITYQYVIFLYFAFRREFKQDTSQSYGLFSVPVDWTVSIVPAELTLKPDHEHEIKVIIEPKELSAKTPMTFNVHAFAVDDYGARSLAGGVTLRVAEA